MKPRFLLAAALLAAHLSSPALADPDATRPVAVDDYTVFVDPPTGFVFVKLPAGWKFVGRVGEADLARLPDRVVTALLAPAPEAVARADEAPPRP